MSETPVAETKAAKKEVVRTPVEMADGRIVEFAGNRQADKNPSFDVETGKVSIVIDFRNGKTISVSSEELSHATLLRAAAHGLSQKIGDSYASCKDVDDMTLAAEEMVKRLKAGEWEAVREAGDSLAGASVVIRALVEVTGKSVEDIKAFLDKKLEAAKAANQKLSRQELYASFRNPASKVGQVIKRMEKEKASKNAKFDADALAAEIAG
jgi:hypothetical protein